MHSLLRSASREILPGKRIILTQREYNRQAILAFAEASLLNGCGLVMSAPSLCHAGIYCLLFAGMVIWRLERFRLAAPPKRPAKTPVFTIMATVWIGITLLIAMEGIRAAQF